MIDQLFVRLEQAGEEGERGRAQSAVEQAEAELENAIVYAAKFDPKVRDQAFSRLEARLEEARRRLEQVERSAGRPLVDEPISRHQFDLLSREKQRELLERAIVAVFVRPPKASGLAAHCATAHRVDIIYADDPRLLLDIPRQGRRDYVQKPWVFPELLLEFDDEEEQAA